MGALALRKLGAPKGVVKSMFETIQLSKYRIGTAFGASKTKYSSKIEDPLQGIGQGNGCRPTLWVVISIWILAMMIGLGFGLQLQTAISISILTFLIYAFVDNTDIVQTILNINATGKEVARKMQEAMHYWEGDIRATGGMLVPEKCPWYIIDFAWANRKWRYKQKEELIAELVIKEGKTHRDVTITRKEANEVVESLGIYF